MKRLQSLFQQLALTDGSVKVRCEASVVSRQTGKKVYVNNTFSVIGAIGVRGREGTTVLILRSSTGKDYLVNWRFSNISSFKVLEPLPCVATLRKYKPAGLVWDTLGVRGSVDTVQAIRNRTIKNGGKLF